MGFHNQVGAKGESIALKELQKKGYRILKTNYKSSHREIDIIALDGERMVFVEVKTRSSFRYGYPEESVSDTKINNLHKAASEFIDSFNWKGDIRFDVISILLQGTYLQQIDHFKDAF